MRDIFDFQHNTPPRVMGSETEYTTQFCLRKDMYFREAIPEAYILDDGYAEADVWLKNGGRVYQEYGDFIEYATPECRSAREVAIHEQAGERLVSDMTTSFPVEAFIEGEQAAAYKRSGYDLVLGRNGKILLSPMSAGHHENYTTFITPYSDSFAASALSSFLATRPIWSGTGLVTTGGYAVSQKGSAINFESSHTINHGDKAGFMHKSLDQRLEVRTGEGNMSQWQIVQKFALTSLILRLIENVEDENIPDELLLPPSDASTVLRYLSRPLSGEDMRLASRHQRSFAEAGLRFAEKHPDLPTEEIAAAEAVIETSRQIDEFTRDPSALPLISNRLDWAAKLDYMLSHGIKREAISTANLPAVSYDLHWEDIAWSGIARRWYRKMGDKKPDERAIRQALHQPPATRAKARTDAIMELHDDIHQIDWSMVSGQGPHDRGGPVTYVFDDPIQSKLGQ